VAAMSFYWVFPRARNPFRTWNPTVGPSTDFGWKR
jgi:hypothetical protein